MIEPKEFEIWCDKPSDRELVVALKQISPFLKGVQNINVLPNNILKIAKQDREQMHLYPLVEYDRPDVMVYYKKKPILVVEITEHGYTGDNPLQRFARAVRSAELKVPFIHFTPFARTRLDEILYTDRVTSSRRVSSRLFEGFMKLSRIYRVPVMGINWGVNDRGTALKPRLNKLDELREVYDELISVIEEICNNHVEDVLTDTDFRDSPVIKDVIALNQKLADDPNTLTSEVRLENINISEVIKILRKPKYVTDLLGRNYFMKGKDHKLIAYLALLSGKIEVMQTVNGNMIPFPKTEEEIVSGLPAKFASKNWFLLYSGYEWRGEPNGGIAANTEIIYCRAENGTTILDKNSFLVVVWPRIFLNAKSPVRAELLESLKGAVEGSQSSALYKLMAEKKKALNQEMEETYIRYMPKSYGVWSEDSTIARIYRSFCDLIVLNDAVLLGNHWIQKPKLDDSSSGQPLVSNQSSRFQQSNFFDQIKEASD